MKIAVLGYGSIGKRHASNLHLLGHETIIYDPAVARTHTAEEAVAASDAAVIASPTNEHVAHLKLCALHQKHVLVEKPIGDGRDMTGLELALSSLKAGNKVVMVGNNLRFHSCVKKAQEILLGEAILGKPQWASFCCAQFNDKPAYMRDGVIRNWGAHEIDLALYLLGPAHVVASSVRCPNGHDDIADISLVHDSGCRSQIHLDYVSTSEHRYFQIAGSKQFLYSNLIEPRFVSVQSTIATHPNILDNFEQDYVTEIQAFLDRIDGKHTLGATGEEGLAVLKICNEVRKQVGLK